MKRSVPKPEKVKVKTYVCNGCGYEYSPLKGDPENEIAPGTPFEKLPEEWVCPECAEIKAHFIES